MADKGQRFVSIVGHGEGVIRKVAKIHGRHRLKELKVVATIRLCLVNKVMYHVMNEESPATVCLKQES